MSNCWPLEAHHYAEYFAVSALFKTDDVPSGSASSRPPPARLPPEKTGGIASIEDIHSFRNSRHPFIIASGCLNPELGQLGEDDAFRWRQARITSYRRDGRSSGPHNNTKNRRHRSNQSRGYHEDQAQVNSHRGNHNSPYTPGQHGSVSRRPSFRLPLPLRGSASGCPRPGRELQRAPTGYLSQRQLTARRWYGTPGPSADSTLGNTSFGFAICSSACCSPFTWCGTNYFC